MSANTIQLTLTEEAATELTSLIKDAAEGSFLRVWVAGGGCSGLSYGMALDDSKEDDDLIVEGFLTFVHVDGLGMPVAHGVPPIEANSEAECLLQSRAAAL